MEDETIDLLVWRERGLWSRIKSYYWESTSAQHPAIEHHLANRDGRGNQIKSRQR